VSGEREPTDAGTLPHEQGADRPTGGEPTAGRLTTVRLVRKALGIAVDTPTASLAVPVVVRV
jgi:hypothetical protein